MNFWHSKWPMRLLGRDEAGLSPGTSASVRSDGQSFCITMTNPAASRRWIYDRVAGRAQEAPEAACDAEHGVAGPGFLRNLGS